MSGAADDLGERYSSAMQGYIDTPSESTLEAAYEIARHAMAGRFGVVDLAAAHQRALRAALGTCSTAAEAASIAFRAMQFLIEALSPFEMTLRGFRDAITRLEHEVVERRQAEDDLKIAHDQLEERVRQRTAELSAANDHLRQEIGERERAERALHETEQTYQALVASVRDYAIFMLDARGIITSWNPGAERMKGYRSDEIVGRHFSVFYTEEDQQAGHPANLLARVIADGACEDEGWRVRQDGSRYWADVLITALRAEDGTLRGFAKVTRDATERRRVQQTLEELNAQLQQSNQEKDQFVAMISHELRNPLSAMSSGLEVLQRMVPADDSARRALDIIRRNVEVQRRLVNDLLDLSRLTRDRLVLQHAPVAMGSVAQTAVNGEEAAAARAGVALSLEAESDLWVFGDADRLQQVMINLLGNAIKFTPAGGRVTVKLFGCAEYVESLGPALPSPRRGVVPDPLLRHRSVCLIVEDTGTGIDQALLPRLFTPFQQGDVASRRQTGLGLGLALVKLITEKHGGKVWAESDGINQGSRFIVALPALQIEPTRGRGARSEAARLLLMEGNVDTRVLLAADLESDGYKVVSAGSAEEALRLLATARPDLIVCGLELSDMSGDELLQRVRKMDGMADVPAFAVGAAGLEEDVRRARAAGFAGCFTKPVDTRALGRAIRALLKAPGTGKRRD